MKQHEFIYLSRNMTNQVRQDLIGNVIVDLNQMVEITHNYKKKDLMTLTMKEDQSKYTIPSRSDLEEIYKIQVSEENPIQLIREYCEKNLKKTQ